MTPKQRSARISAIPPIEFTDKTRAKMRAAKTTEARAALAATVRAKWDEPGERERRRAAMRDTHAQLAMARIDWITEAQSHA